MTAELLYYMRDEPTPVMAWREKGKPQDHFELTRPFGRGARARPARSASSATLSAIRAELSNVSIRIGVRELCRPDQPARDEFRSTH